MKQVPRGDKNLVCPLHKKTMDKVCHKCPWWIQLRGKNPQSNEEIDEWGCAHSFLPILLIENAQEVRQGAAAIESFRNAMVVRADEARVSRLDKPSAGQNLTHSEKVNGQ